MAIPWNHRAVVHRPTETNTTGDPSLGWSLPVTPSGYNARPDQSWTGLLAESPLGEVQAATRIWFLDAGFTDIAQRDVLEITEGPESGTRWKVHSVTKPTKMSSVVHHVEVACHIFEGALV